jgi:hypothetical protein
MVINKTTIKELEHTYRRLFPDDLKRYLLMKYAEEPFPYEYSEQDLYINIRNDIRHYEAGELDVTVKSPTERWQEERSHLQDLYIEKFREARDLEEYAAELEQIISEHGLESSRMAKRRIEDEADPDLNF